MEHLALDDLVHEFAKVTSLDFGDRLSPKELQLAVARIYQVNLWIDQMGAVPGDIAVRDLQFWARLLNSVYALEHRGASDQNIKPEGQMASSSKQH